MSTSHTEITSLSEAERKDAESGMAWWNHLPEYSRAAWLKKADSAAPVDAWRAYKATLTDEEQR